VEYRGRRMRCFVPFPAKATQMNITSFSILTPLSSIKRNEEKSTALDGYCADNRKHLGGHGGEWGEILVNKRKI
jgi:hypothetical protein